MPFFFIFHPVLLFNGTFSGAFISATLTATIGIISLASGLQGWLFTRVSLVQRFLLILTAYLMIEPTLMLDMVGAGLFLVLLIWQFINKRKVLSTDNEARQEAI